MAVASAEVSRTQISVGYEYQLEVEDAQRTGSTQEVLEIVDNDIIAELQRQFPDVSFDTGLPIVSFESIESEIFSACFTESEQCSLVRSTIQITYEGAKPQKSVQYVTLQKIQEYLELATQEKNQVLLSYNYPTIVSSLAQFKMTPVDGHMSDSDVQVMEDTFLEVFGAIIFAIEGDTEVDDASFLYQDLVAGSSEDLTLSTDLQVTGYCRDCTSQDFENMVVSVINENIPAFQSKMRGNTNAVGSSYFDPVSDIQFQVPGLPSALPPIDDESIFDNEASTVRNSQPWFLWFGVGMALCILGLGSCVIAKDQSEYEIDEKPEDELSTSDESENLEEPSGEDYQIETIAVTEDGEDGNYEVHAH